jgi:hypothetical protein
MDDGFWVLAIVVIPKVESRKKKMITPKFADQAQVERTTCWRAKTKHFCHYDSFWSPDSGPQ